MLVCTVWGASIMRLIRLFEWLGSIESPPNRNIVNVDWGASRKGTTLICTCTEVLRPSPPSPSFIFCKFFPLFYGNHDCHVESVLFCLKITNTAIIRKAILQIALFSFFQWQFVDSDREKGRNEETRPMSLLPIATVCLLIFSKLTKMCFLGSFSEFHFLL